MRAVRLFVAFTLTAFLTSLPHPERSLAAGPEAPAWASIKESVVVVGYVTDAKDEHSFYRYGSGFSIGSSADGVEILTDDHVAEPLHKDDTLVVLVPPSDGRPEEMAIAQLTRADPKLDLSVVTAKLKTPLPPLKFSSSIPPESAKIALGGFPFIAGVRFGGLFGTAKLLNGQPADLQPEVHMGAVTALHKETSLIGFDIYAGSVQSGNSGGPLFDPDTGEVYGILDGFAVGETADSKNAGPQTAAAVSNLALMNSAAVAFMNGKSVAAAVPSGIEQTSAVRTGDGPAAGSSIQRAADSGFADAQNALGLMYQFGSGVKQDYTLARHYFQLAADRGNADAQSNLGVIYLYGLGVEADPQTAAALFMKSAAQANARGAYNLARAYQFGEGVPYSLERASFYYDLAARNGSTAASYGIGWLYYAQRKWAQALSAFEAAGDDPNAQYQLGLMYELGIGVDVDGKKALSYYTKAAEQNQPQAQYHLAHMYEYGEFVDRDPVVAALWYIKAKPNVTSSELDHATLATLPRLSVLPGIANAGAALQRIAQETATQTAPQSGLAPKIMRWSDAINDCCLGIHTFGPTPTFDDPKMWSEHFPQNTYTFDNVGRIVVAGNAGTLLRGLDARVRPDGLPGVTYIWLFVPDLDAHGEFPNWLRFCYGDQQPNGQWSTMQEVLEES